MIINIYKFKIAHPLKYAVGIKLNTDNYAQSVEAVGWQ